MTDEYGPFDDQPWAEAEWYDYAPTWARSGVIGTPAAAATEGGLAFASSGLSVSAGPGKAWIRGSGFKRTGTVPTHAVPPNGHASWSRRDRLVLRRDLANHLVETDVIQGVPAASPAAPDLTQDDDGVWEKALHSFLVPPNNGTTLSGLVDERVWIDSAGQVSPPIVLCTMAAGWSAAPGAKPGAFKDASGLIHLVGHAVNGAAYDPNDGSTTRNVLTLPAGHWPASPVQFMMHASSAGTGRIVMGEISTSGVLRITAGTTGIGLNFGHFLNDIPPFHPRYVGDALS